MIAYLFSLLLLQTGFRYVVEGGSIAAVKAADRYIIKATFVEYGGRNVTRKFEAQIYAARSPRKGEPGFRESLEWAKKRFPIGLSSNGKTFGDIKPGVLTQLYVNLPNRPAWDMLSVLLESGMARFSEARVPRQLRTDPAYKRWRAVFVTQEAIAHRNHVGLWKSVWK